MGMWLNIDYMIVPKVDFERWRNGDLYLDLYSFKFIEKDKFDEEFEEWRKANEDEIEDEGDTLYTFANDKGLMNLSIWEDFEYDYPEEYQKIECDDKIIWIRATYG